MKKLLLCAGVLAVMASCAKYDVDTLAPEAKGNAVVFEAAAAEDATRGGWTLDGGTYYPFWYSDDAISIFAHGAKKGSDAATSAFATADVLSYRATKSARRGEFVADDVTKQWNWDVAANGALKNASFFAVYPAVGDVTVNFTADNKIELSVPANYLAEQTQEDVYGDGIHGNLLQWSWNPYVGPEHSYNKVGETVNLNFNYELAGLVFSVKGYDKDTFGALKSITVTAQGYSEQYVYEDGKYHDREVPASILHFGKDGGKLTLSGMKDGNGNYKASLTTAAWPAAAFAYEEANEAEMSENTLTIGDGTNGLVWNDSYKAYMIIPPVNRKAFTDEGVKETIDVTYEFAKLGKYTTSFETSTNWVKGGFYNVPAMDFSSLPYIVLGETLIINEGPVVYKDNNAKVVWPIGDPTKTVLADNIENIIIRSEVATSAAELAKFKAFKNLKTLTLNHETEMPAGMLAPAVAGKLTVLVGPEVTTISPALFATADGSKPGFEVLEALYLPAYGFETQSINEQFFNDKTQLTLEELDMSAVTDLGSPFGANTRKAIVFTDYSALAYVTLNPEGVKLAHNEFQNCTQLIMVDGVLDLSEASYAFQNAGTAVSFNTNLPAYVFRTVTLNNTYIPDYAFDGCKWLQDVVDVATGKQIVPTYVGRNAFSGCANSETAWNAPKFTTMDLSKATRVGIKAFEGSTSYAGVGNDVLVVAADDIEAAAFRNTAVSNIQFTNATKVGPSILANTPKLAKVKFDKTFTGYKYENVDVKATFGGNPNNLAVELYVTTAQVKSSENVLKLEVVPATETADAVYQTYEFKHIYGGTVIK